MANTIDDVVIGNTWVNVYSLSGIAVGTSVQVQNKGNGYILLAISATSPASGSVKGYVLEPFKACLVDAGESGLWAISTGTSSTSPLNVQVA